jgi:hypothetical protein
VSNSTVASLVIPAVGSADPLIREYVHDFGLAAWNVVALEDHLKMLLTEMAVLRAQWPLKVKKLRKIVDRLDEVTLGGLISEYGRLGGKPELVANLRPLNESRKILLHKRVPLTEPGQLGPDRARIAEVRVALQAYARDLFERSNAVSKAQHEVFEALVERVRKEQPPSLEGAVLMDAWLDSHRRLTRDYPEA